MSVLPVCMYHMYAWYLQWSEQGPLELEFTDGCDPPCGFWEPNLSPMPEQQVLF